MITEIRYNWRQCGDTEMWGDDYDIHTVGKNEVTNIENVTPDREETGYSGTEIYNVIFEDGSLVTIFNPNLVTSKPTNS